MGLFILASLIYGFIIFTIIIVNKIIGKDVDSNIRKKLNYNRITIPVSIFLSILFSCYYLFSNPSHNFKIGYLEKSSDKYIITLFGKRNLMAHDPISLLKKTTYIDSVKFEIPRAEGIIDGLEIPNYPGSYKIMKGKAIVLDKETLKVNLFYNNYDRKTIDASTWNGTYKLKWRNQ